MPFFTWFTKLTKGEPADPNPMSTAKSVWFIDESKYLTMSQVRRLRRFCDTAVKDVAGEPKRAFLRQRDRFMVELGLECGLRVNEMARLRIGDLNLNGDPSLIVRMGKGGKTRVVHFSLQFKQACLSFLETKKCAGQPVDREAHVLTTVAGAPITKRTLQKAFKHCIEEAHLSSHFGIHCLRHTYGTHLYKSSGYNLRLVQEQLGHASISTTQVYANLLNRDVRRAVEKLYRA